MAAQPSRRMSALAMSLALGLVIGAPPAIAQEDGETGSGAAEGGESPPGGEAALATASAEQKSEGGGERATPRSLWQDWLDSKGINSGENRRADGSSFFIAAGTAQVRASYGDKKWIDARRAAFNAALLNAKSQLADTVGTVLRSDRSFEILEQGGDEIPPAMQAARDDLSLFDRLRKLGSEAIDAEIQKFDPDWNGGDEEETEKKVLALQERYKEALAASSRLLLEGAIPAYNAEGSNRDGNYTVLVGIAWSPRLAALSESIYNPDREIATVDASVPIRDQLRRKMDEDPDFLAHSQGVRVWNNADGEKVIVSFAPVQRSSSSTRNERKAGLVARTQIAQFVAEDVASRALLDGGRALRQYSDGSREVFDDQTFRSLVRAKAKPLRLQGAVRIHSWEGQHPTANVPMRTDVYLWSPGTREIAQRLESLTDTGAEDGGADVEDTAVQTPQSPARSGAGSNPTNF